MTRLAHRRIQDSKASVRKAAVQLLEALVVLRGRDLARSDPEPISPADITVFEHATTDAMVRLHLFRISRAITIAYDPEL